VFRHSVEGTVALLEVVFVGPTQDPVLSNESQVIVHGFGVNFVAAKPMCVQLCSGSTAAAKWK
jgi:hypothetical protein